MLKIFLAVFLGYFSLAATAQTQIFSVPFRQDARGINAKQQNVSPETPLPPTCFFKDTQWNSVQLSEKDCLSYSLEEMGLDLNKGSLLFWFKPMEWGTKAVHKGRKGVFVPIVSVSNPKGNNWSLLFYLVWEPHGGMNISFRSVIHPHVRESRVVYLDEKLKDSHQLAHDQWSFIALTWNDMGLQVYINGKLVGKADYGLQMIKTPNRLWRLHLAPRQFWNNRFQHSMAFSDLKLYDDSMNSSQISELYQQKLISGVQTGKAVAPVPELKRMPLIDGTFAPGEWDDATVLPVARMNGNGVLNSDLMAFVYLKRDARKLYVGMSVDTDKIFNTGKKDQYDRNLFKGSNFELWWRKPDASVLDFAQLAIAPNNAWAFRKPDGVWGKLDFEHKTTMTEKGWNAEIALDWKKAGIEQIDDHDFQFCMHRPEYNDMFNEWIVWNCHVSRKSLNLNMGKLHFKTDIAVRLTSLGDLNLGTCRILCSSSERLDYRIAESMNGQRNSESQKNQSQFVRRKKLQPGRGIIELNCRKAGGKVFAYGAKVIVKEPFLFTPVCHAAQNTFVCDIDVRGLASQLKESLSRKEVICRLELLDGAKCRKEASHILTAPTASLSLPFGNIPKGEYTLKATLRWPGGTCSKEISITKPDDIFLRDRKGIDHSIPYPFRPIELKGNHYVTGNLQYQFAENLPFPISVISDSRQLLKKPVRLKLRLNGRDAVLLPRGKSYSRVSDDHVITRGSLFSEEKEIAVHWLRDLAYDGMIRYDLRLEPLQKNVQVDEFRVETVVAAEFGRYALTGAYAEDWKKHQKVQAFPSLWLTGVHHGFIFFTDNDANWCFQPNRDPLRAERTVAGDCRMEAVIIERKTHLTTAVPYVLAMMGTPSKKVRSDWRNIHDSGWGKLKGQTLQTVGWAGMGHNIFKRCFDFSQPQYDNIAYWTRRMAQTDAGVRQLLPYLFMCSLPSANPIFDYYAHDWQRKYRGVAAPRFDFSKDPIDGADFYFAGVQTCANKEAFSDYLCYYLNDFLEKSPGFVGLYTDGSSFHLTDFPYRRTNITPFLNPRQKVRNYDLFGLRDFYERAYKIVRRQRGPQGMVYIHNWDTYYPFILSFVDIVYPGEEFMHVITKGLHTYISHFPLEKWQSNYNGTIMGAGVQFLGQWRKFGGDLNRLPPEKRRAYTRPVLMMCLLHDIPLSGAWYPAVEEVWELFKRKSVDRAVFTGYWDDCPCTVNNPSVKVSSYHWKNKRERLVVLGNLSEKPVTAVLRMEGDVPGEAIDALSGKPIDLTEINLEKFGFRLICFQKK